MKIRIGEAGELDDSWWKGDDFRPKMAGITRQESAPPSLNDSAIHHKHGRASSVIKTYRLSWYPFLRSLGYLLVAEMFGLGLLSIPERGPMAGFLLGLWWLWPALTILLGLAVRAGTRLAIGPARIGLIIFGKPWRSLYWQGISRARLLKVGGTVVILAQAEKGFRLWRQSGLAAPDEVAEEIRRVLGPKLDQALIPPYQTRRGRTWSGDAGRILFSSPAGERVYEPASLRAVKYLFVEGEDLPVRIHLFPTDGDEAPMIGQGVSFFPILAADILRFARENGIRTVCADLGKDRPRLAQRREETKAIPRRAWEEEGCR